MSSTAVFAGQRGRKSSQIWDLEKNSTFAAALKKAM